jgi:hypothetical protein
MRSRCYRYTATPTRLLQSYFMKPPIKSDGTCEYFWEADAADAKGNCDE